MSVSTESSEPALDDADGSDGSDDSDDSAEDSSADASDGSSLLGAVEGPDESSLESEPSSALDGEPLPDGASFAEVPWGPLEEADGWAALEFRTRDAGNDSGRGGTLIRELERSSNDLDDR